MIIYRRIFGHRPFVSAPYFVFNEKYSPENIDRCPLFVSFIDCEIRDRGWRERKKGPEYPLKICKCLIHICCFTVYPPGYGPYERRPLALLSHDGQALSVPESLSGEADRLTSFVALVDFNNGKWWPPDLETAWALGWEGIAPGVYRTQIRHIARLADFFGINPDRDDDFRLETYRTIAIPTQELIDSAARIRDGPSLRQLAREEGMCLQKILPLHQFTKELIKQGKNIGLWGTPLQQ
jgi:hypothetical protein